MKSQKTYFVLGFMITPDHARVVLIRKERPSWQQGKLNGIGGHVEPGELPAQAMRREFREETGVDVPEGEWFHYGVMRKSDAWEVDLFVSFGDPVVHTQTDEVVFWVDMLEVQSLRDELIQPNLRYLIPAAIHYQAEQLTMELNYPIHISGVRGE